MAAFSTPFWAALIGIAAVAGGVSYVARDDGRARNAAAAYDSGLSGYSSAALADRTQPDHTDHTDQTDPADAPPARRAAVVRSAAPFSIDTLGRLVVSTKTLAVMDSWLAQAPQPGELAALEPRLRAELPPLAAERAYGLLRSYASYRAAERALLQQLKAQPTLTAREQLDQTMALRRRHFDSVSVQELFGVQEARSLYASEVARILADGSLSEAQQAQRIQALRLGLPPEVAAQEFGGTDFSLAMEREAANMRERGEPDAEVAFMRRQFVDVEGARSQLEIDNEKLAAQKQAWELRHPGFVRERDAVLASEAEEADKQAHMERLLRQHFSAAEIDEARAHAGR